MAPTFVQIDDRNAFRLMDGERWLGTVWQHVCGFSWARLWPEGGAAEGSDVETMEAARESLLAAVATPSTQPPKEGRA